MVKYSYAMYTVLVFFNGRPFIKTGVVLNFASYMCCKYYVL